MTQASAALAALLTVLSLTLVPVEGVAASPAASPSVSSASARAAERTRCTIVGTPRADRLRGTRGRDVICGRGGSDVLVGGAGDDVLIGGPGRDKLVGGPGSDRVEGGSGNDRLDGSGGTDLLVGGASRDVADGGTGEDRVLGGGGDDRLDGGPQADEVDGGSGTNDCVVDAQDTTTRCVYDEEDPVAWEVTVSATEIDVTHAPATVTVRVHAGDDTRVQDVIVTADGAPWFPGEALRLEAGSRRSGWWEGTLRFPRYAPPGNYVPHVKVIDRMRRDGERVFADAAFEVRDDDPDLDQPAVALLAPLPTTAVDTRTRGRSLIVRARITDAKSGVANVNVLVFEKPRPGGDYRYWSAGPRLVSGTRTDGIWEADVWLDQGVLGGEWTVAIAVEDRAHEPQHEMVTYWGPNRALYESGVAGEPRDLPEGRGSFQVLGTTATDAQAPLLSAAAVTPSSVDTLPGPASVTASVRVRDNVRVEHVTVWLRAPDQGAWGDSVAVGELDLASGTRRDGIWTGTVTLPQGTPPGRYQLWIWAMDPDLNDATCVGSGYPGDSVCRLDTDPVVTVIDTRG